MRPGGELRIGLLDEQGKPIPGRSAADCRPITGDHSPATVEWTDGADLSAWTAKPVQLQFELKDADVFGFQFVAGP